MFRTTEISNPEFESNNLRYITVKTPNLKGRGDICLFVPGDENLEAIPIVILMHGVYGSAWSWALKAGIHLTANDMIKRGTIQPMVIAMPSDGLWGDGSGYIPHSGLNFEKWIIEDVPNAVIENIKVVNTNSKLFISGLSMGGFGALRLGAKYANKFKAISAHSAITAINQMPMFVEEPLNSYRQEDKNEESVISLIEKQSGSLPALRFDCGTEDPLLTANRTLHQQLVNLGIKHRYDEYSGGHDWSYWQEHIKESLLFFNEIH